MPAHVKPENLILHIARVTMRQKCSTKRRNLLSARHPGVAIICEIGRAGMRVASCRGLYQVIEIFPAGAAGISTNLPYAGEYRHVWPVAHREHYAALPRIWGEVLFNGDETTRTISRIAHQTSEEIASGE